MNSLVIIFLFFVALCVALYSARVTRECYAEGGDAIIIGLMASMFAWFAGMCALGLFVAFLHSTGLFG